MIDNVFYCLYCFCSTANEIMAKIREILRHSNSPNLSQTFFIVIFRMNQFQADVFLEFSHDIYHSIFVCVIRSFNVHVFISRV